MGVGGSGVLVSMNRWRRWLEDSLDDARVAWSGGRGAIRLRRVASSPAGVVALTLLCLAVYLPGALTLPVVDRDEARFAQASRQMFESVALPRAERSETLHDGGLVVPKFGETPRLNKPPLIYWLQSASAAIFTRGDPSLDAIWMYRMPSLVAAIITVIATLRIGLRFFDPRAAWLAAALLAVCPLMAWEARQARADQVLVAATTVAILLLARVGVPRGKEPDRPTRVITTAFWLAVASGVMVKGPITPMIVGLASLSISLATRRWRWMLNLRPLSGLAIVAAILAAWVIPLARHIDLSRYLDLVAGETLGRASSAREGHSGPPGYHTVLTVVLFWPGVMVTAAAVVRAWQVARGQTDASDRPTVHSLMRPWIGRRAQLFCLAWLLPAWLVFELSSTKLPHYTLPLYPALALLSARGVLAAGAGSLDFAGSFPARLGLWLWVGVGFALTVGLPVATLFLGAGWPVVILTAMFALGAAWLMLRARASLTVGRPAMAQIWSIAAATVGLTATLTIALPNVSAIWTTERLEQALDTLPNDMAKRVVAAGYHEDSLVFATRGRVERIDDPISWAIEHRGGVVIMPASEIATLEADPESPPYREHATVAGFNYSNGRFLRLSVVVLGSPDTIP